MIVAEEPHSTMKLVRAEPFLLLDAKLLLKSFFCDLAIINSSSVTISDTLNCYNSFANVNILVCHIMTGRSLLSRIVLGYLSLAYGSWPMFLYRDSNHSMIKVEII